MTKEIYFSKPVSFETGDISVNIEGIECKAPSYRNKRYVRQIKDIVTKAMLECQQFAKGVDKDQLAEAKANREAKKATEEDETLSADEVLSFLSLGGADFEALFDAFEAILVATSADFICERAQKVTKKVLQEADFDCDDMELALCEYIANFINISL